MSFPSAARSGIKINLDKPIVVDAGGTTTALVDFDVDHSFVVRGATIAASGLNFTPVVREGYRIGVPEPGAFHEVINSDSLFYGGSNVGNAGFVPTKDGPHHGHNQYLSLVLPPLGCLILRST